MSSDQVSKRFRAHFGRFPGAIGTAPGRVNLIGEHIDYNGGTVLPTVLPNRVMVAIAPNEAGHILIRSDRFEGEITRPVGEAASGHWSDYIVGTFAGAAERGWAAGGFDIYVESTLPDGAGVSSSAALCTAILRAITECVGVTIEPVEIAMTARAVENDYIGLSCGIMDQMAVGLVGEGEALALDTKYITTETIKIPEDWRFITVHSGIHRKLSDGRYEARFEECAEAARLLKVAHLCEATLPDVETLPEPLPARARHVVVEHQRVLKAITAMKDDDMSVFGRLMTESHRSYSENFQASTPDIDALVTDAIALGAKGARLTGGGFGGCTVSLLKAGEEDTWLAALLERHPKAWRV